MADQPFPKLYLSSSDKRLTGLCGGIAEYLNTDSSLIRLAWIILTILTGIVPGIIAYIIASIVIPVRPVDNKNGENTNTR